MATKITATIPVSSPLPHALVKILAFVLLVTVTFGGICSTLAAEGEISESKQSAAPAGRDWPLFRGNALSDGVSQSKLPDQPEVLWKFTVDKSSFEATATIVDGVVYVGDMDHSLYALKLATGEKIWKFDTESGFAAAPAVRNGLLYVGDLDGKFYCLDATNGKVKWTAKAEAEIDSSANFYKDKVLFGAQDATLYCYTADKGEEVWKFMIGDQIRCMPTVVGNRVFLAGCDGKLHVVNVDKGEEVDSVVIEAPTGSTPAAAGDVVYFGTEGATFFCIDWKTAKIVWNYHDEKHSQPFRSSAAVTADAVYVGGRDRQMHAFDPANGIQLWTFATRNRIDSSPVVVGDRLFFGSADGRLYGLERKTGKKVWEYEAGGGFAASPAVAAGRMVIGNDDGTLYCFGAK